MLPSLYRVAGHRLCPRRAVTKPSTTFTKPVRRYCNLKTTIDDPKPTEVATTVKRKIVRRKVKKASKLDEPLVVSLFQDVLYALAERFAHEVIYSQKIDLGNREALEQALKPLLTPFAGCLDHYMEPNYFESAPTSPLLYTPWLARLQKTIQNPQLAKNAPKSEVAFAKSLLKQPQATLQSVGIQNNVETVSPETLEALYPTMYHLEKPILENSSEQPLTHREVLACMLHRSYVQGQLTATPKKVKRKKAKKSSHVEKQSDLDSTASKGDSKEPQVDQVVTESQRGELPNHNRKMTKEEMDKFIL